MVFVRVVDGKHITITRFNNR